jgi:hypothetical protein
VYARCARLKYQQSSYLGHDEPSLLAERNEPREIPASTEDPAETSDFTKRMGQAARLNFNQRSFCFGWCCVIANRLILPRLQARHG